MNIYEHLLVWWNITYPEIIALRKMSAPRTVGQSLAYGGGGTVPCPLSDYKNKKMHKQHLAVA